MSFYKQPRFFVALGVAIVGFNAMAGIKSQAIHYKGEAPAVIDLLGGQLPYMFANLPTVQPYPPPPLARAKACARTRIL